MSSDSSPTQSASTEIPQAVAHTVEEGSERPSNALPERNSMPEMEGAWNRFVCQRLADWAEKRVVSVSGLEHIGLDRGPFVLAANHSQRMEAVFLPAILFRWRFGKRIHFFADWPMMLVPGIGTVYRVGQVIPVFGKDPKVKLLARLRPYYQKKYPGTAWERAAEILARGDAVGSFPEGTVNRDPRHLLRGRVGAARLALENGVPVVPVGIRFPDNDGETPIGDRERMVIRIGAPIDTGAAVPRAPASQVRDLHREIMEELSRLSGKAWRPDAPRDRRRKQN